MKVFSEHYHRPAAPSPWYPCSVDRTPKDPCRGVAVSLEGWGVAREREGRAKPVSGFQKKRGLPRSSVLGAQAGTGGGRDGQVRPDGLPRRVCVFRKRCVVFSSGVLLCVAVRIMCFLGVRADDSCVWMASKAVRGRVRIGFRVGPACACVRG